MEDKNFQWDRKVLLSASGKVSALAAAAFLGAWATAFMSKPSLEIELIGPVLNTQVTAIDDVSLRAKAPENLVAASQNSTWLRSLSSEETSLDIYLDGLVAIQEEAQGLVQDMRALRADMASWPQAGSRQEMSEKVYEILRDNYGIVFPHIFGEAKRRNNVIISNFSDVSGIEEAALTLKLDMDGDYHVSKGMQNLPIIWTTQDLNGVYTEELRKTAENIAMGLLYGDAVVIGELRGEINNLLLEEMSTGDLLRGVEEELRSYSYLQVTAIVSNNGKDPISISPNAALYVDMSKLPKNGVSREDSHQLQRVAIVATETMTGRVDKGENPRLEEMLVPTAKPMIIKGGEAIAVTFRSKKRVRYLPGWSDLLAAYESGSVLCRLAVLPVTGHVGSMVSTEPSISRPHVFKEFDFEQVFPENVEM